MDTIARTAAREYLDVDERIEHTAALMDLVGQLCAHIGQVQHELAKLDEAVESPITTAWIAGLLGPSRRYTPSNSPITRLLAAAQDRAVKLARANHASWAAIGEQLDEDPNNLSSRYRRKGAEEDR